MIRKSYTQGVCEDGAAILCDGEPMTIEEILHNLRILESVRYLVKDAPKLDMEYDTLNQIEDLDRAMSHVRILTA